ncbi:RHS repeat protein [Legionella sp. km772]|uniref:RHS repeat protein n=1 Tax=Legionella sp. km772 TaxID=2498111 RepID=UPI000F8F4219|nr:RHS repeat protein [Legionella sp. km772]RUR06590.1 RHS repeat protein [Legionella sp. km772]
MPFFNVITSPGLGKINEALQQEETFYGQAKLSINTNPLNGNLFIKEFAQTFVDQGFHFGLSFCYNSQASTPWKLNKAKVIKSIQGPPNQVGSLVIVEECDSHESVYSYVPARDCYVNLTANSAASILTYKDGQWSGWNPITNSRELYNKHNQLEKITDHSGNYLAYIYDDQSRIVQIQGNSGTRISLTYTSEGSAIYAHDNDKKRLVMQYIFDEQKRLTKTLIPLDNQEPYTIEYTYFENSNLLKRISQSDQTEVYFEYKKGKLFKITNGTGNQYQFSYQTNSTDLIGPLGYEQSFATNKRGLLKKYTYHQQEQEYYYDFYNRIQSIHHQDGTVEEYLYDDLGFPAHYRDRCNEQVFYHYDPITGLLGCLTQKTANKEVNTFYLYNQGHLMKNFEIR